MEPYIGKKPRYVREWYLKLRARMKKIRAEEGDQALDLTLTRAEIRQKHKEEKEKELKDKTPKRRIAGDKDLSISSYDEPSEEGNEQSDYDDKLAMEI